MRNKTGNARKALDHQRRPGGAASDETLVKQALDGDRRAFERLVERHQKPLVNHLYRLTGRGDRARDLAQEVFIKVYVSLSSFDPRYRFTTWLYRIASNCAIDELRRKRPQVCSLSQRPPGESGEATEDSFPGSAPTPDEMFEVSELRDRLNRAVQALPTDYRQLILLRHRLYCRYDEIARITDLPLGTVKNRIFRAREMLRGELGQDLFESGGAR